MVVVETQAALARLCPRPLLQRGAVQSRLTCLPAIAGGLCSHLLLEFRPATSFHLSAADPEAGEGAFGEGMGGVRWAG